MIAKGIHELELDPRMANRHGLIAGATGTGKTVTLHVMAERFSEAGVPVFLTDIKGDLAGLSQRGIRNSKIDERVSTLKLKEFTLKEYPVVFWDVFGQLGHPLRSTVSEMGPVLLARLLNLNDTQSAVLSLAFRVADDQKLLLLDLKDLRSLVQFVSEHASELQAQYGNVSAASVGAIQRGLLELETEGATSFFGEPAISLDDFIQTGPDGRGVVNILAAEKLFQSPKLYATFLLWLLSELFENLPEVGDPDKPKMVFFFDEAHLLFKDMPNALQDKIEQVVRLIRSKGVGVYFVTQNPLDIPAPVLGQLGNRVQHALRAFTPQDQKAVRAAADTFRANPGVDTFKTITELEVGEALVSFLDEKGTPAPVERAFICPPQSLIGAIPPPARQAVIQSSTLYGHYEKAVDRESAYETLQARTAQASATAPVTAPIRTGGRVTAAPPSELEKMATSALRAASSQLGRSIVRGILGSIMGGTRRRY